jgi:hypothetical protein
MKEVSVASTGTAFTDIAGIASDTSGGVQLPFEEQLLADEKVVSAFCSREAFQRSLHSLKILLGPVSLGNISPGEVQDILERAWAAQGELFDAAAARQWATNDEGEEFRFSTAMKCQDGAELAALNGDLVTLVRRRQAALTDSRLNATRVKSLFFADSAVDYARARDIATAGMRVFVTPDFVPSSVPPKLRKTYLEAAPAVNKLMADMWHDGKLLLLPTEMVKTIPGIHFSPISWAPKADKKEGRPIGDLSYPRGRAVNSDAAADLVRQAWGAITLPSIQDIIRMVLEAADQFGWDNIELWKMDLKGAFTLLNFYPEDVRFLAFELTEGLTAVHIVGMFGWCGCPFGFAVFSRLIIDLVNRRLGRKGVMYVDDVCMAGPAATGAAERLLATQLIEEVMGPGSVAPAKTEFGRCLPMTGWDVDLDRRRVSLSRKNLYKTLFAFFAVDLGQGVTLPVLQALASRAVRAALLSVAMTPFTRGLFQSMSFYQGDRQKKRKLTAEAKFEILMWRAYLVQLMWNPEAFARPLDSFRDKAPQFRIEFDASLTGIGFQISAHQEREGSVHQWHPWVHWGGDLPFELPPNVNPSAHQNLCEFTAVLAAVLVLRLEGFVDFVVEVVGDNTASLSWLRKGRANSSLARRASIGLSLLLAHTRGCISSATHVAGVFNTQMDGLSRGKGSLEVNLPPHLWCRHMAPEGWVQRYLRLCRPEMSEVCAVGSLECVQEFLRLLVVPVSPVESCRSDPILC